MTYERDNIRAMQGYTSGEQPDDARTIKLNTNENPYPPAPGVSEALRAFDPIDLRRYPPATARPLRTQIAALHGLAENEVIATRGGDELLRLLITTFVEPGRAIGTTRPSYSLYGVLAAIHDSPVFEVDLTDDFGLPADFAADCNRNDCALTLIVNPHAPSGRLFSAEEIRAVASESKGVVLVDEAYVDFVDPGIRYDVLPLLREFDNLIVLRTLSKGYSLAGLRLGYGLGPASLIQPMLQKTRDSYNLDAVSQVIAASALADQTYARSTWEKVRSERVRMEPALQGLGFTTWPTQTNFLLAKVPDDGPSAADVYAHLKNRGVLVRFFGTAGMDDKLRVTVGTPDENQRLLNLLNELYGTSTAEGH